MVGDAGGASEDTGLRRLIIAKTSIGKVSVISNLYKYSKETFVFISKNVEITRLSIAVNDNEDEKSQNQKSKEDLFFWVIFYAFLAALFVAPCAVALFFIFGSERQPVLILP
jgi:hypothetical protein